MSLLRRVFDVILGRSEVGDTSTRGQRVAAEARNITGGTAMKIKTPKGKALQVRSWGYQLQAKTVQELVEAPHDLIVMDYSKDGSGENAFTAAEIAQIKKRPGVNSVVISYMCIGEASDFRDHWRDEWTTKWKKIKKETYKAGGQLTDKAPSWLGAWNEDWPNSRKVRFWDPEWQAIIFNDEGTGWLDQIIAQGFDGVYLDIVDGYHHWGTEVREEKLGEPMDGDPETEKESAARMIDFVVALSQHARKKKPDFLVIPQNASPILDALEDEDPARKKAYLKAISAIACESLFFAGPEDENNDHNENDYAVECLEQFGATPVMCVDYLNDGDKIAEFYGLARAKGFLPYAAPTRELDELGDPYDGSAEQVA